MKKTALFSVLTAAVMMLSGCGKKESGSKNKDSGKNSAETEESGNLMFGSGLAKFYDKDTELYGYIDKNGEWVIEPQFAAANPFCEGYAIVLYEDEDTHRLCFIDKTGKKFGSDEYEIYGDFSSGLALALDTKTQKLGYINAKGEWAIEPQFDQAGNFIDGIAGIRIDEKSGFIDTEGNYIAEPEFSQAFSFSDGLALVTDQNDDSYYIDIKGERVLDAPAGAESFYEGRAVVMTIDENENDVFGVIDKDGEWIVEPGDFILTGYSDGLCKAYLDGKTGYLDLDGKWAIEPKFESADDFSGGLAAATDNETGLYGFIGKNGEWVIEPQYNMFKPFTDDGYAYVNAGDDGLHIIDRDGNIIK